MQKRLHEAWATSYEEAQEIVDLKLFHFPEQPYQIKRRADGRFEVVRRIPTKDSLDQINPNKKRKRKVKHL